MASNLLGAGFEVVAHTRTQSVLAEIEGKGAVAAAGPAAVAAEADVVVTMLPDSGAVAEVMRGEAGVFSSLGSGKLVIDMSTIDPEVSRELAAEAQALGSEMLDAPVSGGDVGAREGTLSIMVGGSEAAFERARPVFEAMGKTIVRVGEAGAGQVVKACNQVVVAGTYAAVSEALVLGTKNGVDAAKILDVLSGGLAANRIMEVRRDNFLNHSFEPGFRVDLQHKDLGIALRSGDGKDVPMPVTALVQQLYQALRAAGEGGLDHSALLKVTERAAGIAS